MLNMKKGLAIVLAAATALTFAPVSTLGLTGVVEAQAATAVNATDYKVANPDAWNNSSDETVNVTLNSADAAKQYAAIELTGSTNGTRFTITNPDGTHVTRYTTAEKNDTATNIGDSFTVADGKRAVVAFQAKANGKTTAKIKAETLDTYGKKVTATATLTLNFVVNGPVSSAKFEDSAINVLGAAGTATTDADIDFTGALKGDTYYLVSGNSAIFTVADKTDGTTVNGKLSADAKDTVKLTSVADGDTYLYVYADQTSADADTDHTKALAKVPVHVAGYSLTATASNFTTVDKLGTLNITTAGASDNVTLKFFKGYTDVTDQFKLYKDKNGLAESNPVTAASNTATVYVKAPEAGTYTVEAAVGTKTVKTTFTVASTTASADADNSDTAKSDVYGGVTTSLKATDNTSYSLVNSDAQFKLNGTWYTANQLKWYLTQAPSTTPSNMSFTAGAGSITESGTGKLDVKVVNATTFANEIGNNKTHIVGIYAAGAKNTVVYDDIISVTAEGSGVVTKQYNAGTITKTLADVNKNPVSKDLLDGITFIGTNNKFLHGNDSTLSAGTVNGANFDLSVVDATDAGVNAAKGSSLTSQGKVTRNGVYYEKYYVDYTDTTEGSGVKFVAEITVNVSVNAGPKVEVKEGNFVYSNTTGAKDDTKVIDLDLAANKTFDLAKRIYSDKDNTTYAYNVDTQNVTVDAKGIVTAAKVGTATVKITPTANGVSGDPVYVFFRVNQNANDQISVVGKDGDKATVLTTRQFAGNNMHLTSSERNLAAAQVGYVQVEVTGNETADVKEALTVKGAGTLTYALAGEAKHGESVDAKTGQITIPHSYLNSTSFKSYVFPVKVTSSETQTSALTTGYFYVVVDYPDAQITGLESSYEVGTSLTATLAPSWLNLGLDENYGPKHVSSNAVITPDVLDKNDDLDDSKLYTDDDQNAFDWYGLAVTRATKADKTEHVLLSASDSANKVGNTYKVVTLKSVAGKNNYVTKIENVATGKTLYESSSAVSGASITIDRTTKVKVTVAYAPDNSLNPKDDPAFTIWAGEKGFNYNTVNVFVAATENPKTYEITLIPSQEGTQIISISPTEGRLSKTDYSLVGEENFNLAVKYDATAATTKPAKVTGVKVSNKKGSKVTVSFKKVTTVPTIKYYVQKKIGKKTSGKSIGSTKTTLSVKKGATVKVRVKAYYYDENGSKHVGAYSAWKTLKTDKK
ncbi:MAG: hypothetical protein II177_01320 [Lachnospiraceae bacterium]|nr:hypothetical protein [Lachnospiraceae bacterium]